ncbi:E3 Ubiquitin-Protein Ligase Huwe1 [Manis pentadactyla]|nr:E3 Ubiquitin-Protein Ligase Huwe1 [Manis pentadactyla]
MKFALSAITFRKLSTNAIWVRNKTSPHHTAGNNPQQERHLLRILTQRNRKLPSHFSAQKGKVKWSAVNICFLTPSNPTTSEERE